MPLFRRSGSCEELLGEGRSTRHQPPSSTVYPLIRETVTDERSARRGATTLASAADERRRDLGRQAATDAPIWAVEALGAPPTPDRTEDRTDWEKRAASVASYREMVGHDDESDPLGQPPKPGQVETHAAWRAVWRTLGRPEAERAEAEMCTGQLRIRIRAYEREKVWALDMSSIS